MMTDPLADMLTRIRNAVRIEHAYVEMPSSRLKCGVADALKREGYIWDWEVVEASPQNVLRINLKYGNNGERVIQKIVRNSKPGCRRYLSVKQMRPILNGLGITVLSTSQGVLSNREARQRNVGGELLCTVW
jgi:small subunit ribosomal protein S8